MKKKYYIIYKIIFEDGHYYIGQHKTNNINDDYIGSGVKLKEFRNAHPTLSYNKQILCYCTSIGELNKKEKEYINDLYITDDLCLNMKEGGWGHTMSSEAKKHISEGVKKAMKDPDIRKKCAKGGKGKTPWNKGLKTSDEVKQKQSIAHIGIQTGEKHPMYGKNIKDFMTPEKYELWKQHISNSLKGHKSYEWTDEQRKAMSKRHKGSKLSEQHKQKIRLNSNIGKKCINNGIRNKYIYDYELESYLINGWVLGGKTKK